VILSGWLKVTFLSQNRTIGRLLPKRNEDNEPPDAEGDAGRGRKKEYGVVKLNQRKRNVNWLTVGSVDAVGGAILIASCSYDDITPS